MSKAKIAAGVLALCIPVVTYFEGYIPYTFADPISVPTACFGHTGPDVLPNKHWTRGECDELLHGDLAIANAHVNRCIPGPKTLWQEAALTSATFNAGPVIVCGSTLQRKANAGDWAGACAELSRWTYAHGVQLRGLVKRRAAERALCESHGPQSTP